MNIYLEIFGYIGTCLVILSMMMSSVTKLRIINMCGSVISGVYAGISLAWPICVMNICLFLINGYHLLKHYLHKNTMEFHLVKHDDTSLLHFINHNKTEILKMNPNLVLNFNSNTNIYLLYNKCEMAGIVVGNTDNTNFILDLIYVLPKFRDSSNTQILPTILSNQNIDKVTSRIKEKSYNLYLEKLGFKIDDNSYIKHLH